MDLSSLRIMHLLTAAAAKSLQWCPTLCDPIDGSPPGSPVPGILQPRTLEWVAISFSNAWKWNVKVKLLSCVWLFATPWTVAYQAPHPWDFPGKSSGVGCHLRNKWQGSPALTFSFLTNPTSLHYTWLLYTRLQGRKFCRSVKKDFFQDSCGSPPPSRHWPLGLPFSGVVLATGCPREVLELRVTPQGALLPGARSAWHGFPASLH